MADPTIRAAGVVVLRTTARGPKVLLVHRPHHKDWSLPKGKLDRGEHVVTAAVRECLEETGIVPVLGPYLGRQRYRVMGRPKTVDYWSASVGTDAGFTADNEIDAIRWVTPSQAKSLLSYKRDFDMVTRALGLPPTVPLIVLRHTAATKRSDYTGKDDTRRPLTARGRGEARRLVPLLSAYGIDRLHSSDSARCLQTLKPFAAEAAVKISPHNSLSEPGFEAKPKATASLVADLLREDEPICLCTHRPVLPGILERLSDAAGKRMSPVFREALPPGGMVVIHRHFAKSGMVVTGAERHEV